MPGGAWPPAAGSYAGADAQQPMPSKITNGTSIVSDAIRRILGFTNLKTVLLGIYLQQQYAAGLNVDSVLIYDDTLLRT